jgi:hypothetical protein
MCINIVIGSSKIKLLGLMKKLNFDLNHFKYLKNYNLCSEPWLSQILYCWKANEMCFLTMYILYDKKYSSNNLYEQKF